MKFTERPYLSTSPSRIATVTPVYRNFFSDDDQISLSWLQRFLGRYENVIVAPDHLCVSLPGFKNESFPGEYFRSVADYNRLLLSEEFYTRFSRYDYILIYQLDCLVFSDALLDWCEQGWDYIGAPWLTDFATQGRGGVKLWRVGNGGFSLRRVSSFLKVFRDFSKWSAARMYWHQISQRLSGGARFLRLPKALMKAAGPRRKLAYYLEHNVAMEDWFWGVEANEYAPGFRVPPPEVAVSFAFETDPSYCFEQNRHQLPFGAHAWARYDREFWLRHALSREFIL